MLRNLFLVFLSVLFGMQAQNEAHGQTSTFQVGNPLDIQASLSGNFGELRPNHFHGGLDLKTAAREGLRVHSVSDGYVSRIKISPYGYGKAVYVTHPSGYTTVYGHLSALTDSVARYAKRVQYEQKSFSIDVYPGINDLRVSKGQLIALSGNTGGSGGPHLHFEVRETETEVPRNPLLFGFPLEDHKRPVIEAIGIAPLSSKSDVSGSSVTRHYRTTSNGSISTNGTLKVKGSFGIEVRGYDQQDGSSNQNGIYKLSGFIDDVLFAQFVADSISFDLSRHLNALIDYEYYYQKHQRFVRMYRLPGNMLENVTYVNNGRLTPEIGIHQVRIEAEDVHGNMSVVNFELEYQQPTAAAEEPTDWIYWNKDYYYESEAHQLHIPAGALYDNEELDVVETEQWIEVLSPQIPLQKSIEVKVKAPESEGHNLIARLNRDGKAIRALQTRREGDWLVAESRSLGRFGASTDLKNPVIKSVNFAQGSTLRNSEIVFQIQDNFSGIESFFVTINNNWVLAEYDPKRSRLAVSRNEIERSTEMQELKVVVTDMAGNVATFEGTFLNP